MLFLYAGMSHAKGDTTMYYTVQVEDSFDVQLNECGSCGYSWQWVNKSRVDNVDTLRTSYVNETHPEGYVGYPQILVITFKGIKAGTDTVKLVYGRSWEPGVQKDTAFIIVRVRDKLKSKAGTYVNVSLALLKEDSLSPGESGEADVFLYQLTGGYLTKKLPVGYLACIRDVKANVYPF